MPIYHSNLLPAEHKNAPLTQKGIDATFHLANGKTKQLKFQHNDPVKLGSRIAFFKIVWDGTYQETFYSNESRLQSFCESSLNRGFFNFNDEMIPFMEVTKITKVYFDYQVPLDTYIHQGD